MSDQDQGARWGGDGESSEADLLQEVLSLPAEARPAFLEEHTSDNPQLRARLERLVRGAEASGFTSAIAGALGREAGTLVGRRRVPTHLGGFDIDEEIGRGGMGVVYLGRDTRLERTVAIKAVAPEIACQPDLRARFEREARLLAAVDHPHVATIHSLEESDGELLLVMEYLEGEGLDERLRRGHLGLEETVRLGAEVAAALEAAHERGVIHRDLKPANVKANRAGAWKVLDFGLALDAGGVEESTAGRVAGTPGYTSPEQVRGEELDAATDTWALGCVLYECLSGAKAFGGAGSDERCEAVLRHEPAWDSLPEDLPAPLRQLLRSLLEKDRMKRLSSATAVRAALESLAPGAASPSRPVALPPHALPTERDAFVGREEDLAALAARLDGDMRLVSVLGPAGTGKTRLVQHHAWQALPAWPGGAWLCDLSEARDQQGIVQAVAKALDVPLGKDDAVVQLGNAIAGRGRCLVILDNFEQVAKEAEGTLGRWLERCPEASFVATTREVLGLAGEERLPLGPLLPAQAEELFATRARTARPHFEPDEGERRAIAQLVELLDGLPLAIELAAARVRLFTPEQVLERMGERFKLLTGRSPTGRDRHATLRAALDWSWDLLEDWEKAALAQLSVFRGGFDLEAAESVLDLAAWPEAPWAMDCVQALADKSLVQPEARARFRLLASVQQHSAEKLRAEGAFPGSGDEAARAAEQRHGAHHAALGATESLEALHGPGGTARRTALARDLGNLVAACQRAVQRGDSATAVPALRAAWEVLRLSGPPSAAIALGDQVLALAELEPADRSSASFVLAEALYAAGRSQQAQERLEEALALARGGEDRRFIGLVLAQLGDVLLELGRVEEAQECRREALAIARELGSRRDEANCLSLEAMALKRQGRADEARRLYEEGRAIAREIGNRRSEGTFLFSLANLDNEQGREEAARSHYEQALAICREVGDRCREGGMLGNLGNLHADHGRPDEAQRCWQEALAIHRAVGNRREVGALLTNRANLHFTQGRPDEALRDHLDALAIARETGFRILEAVVLVNLGNVEADQGRPNEARRHWEESLALHRALGSRREEAIVLGDLGNLAMSQGRLDEARGRFTESLATTRELGFRLHEGHVLGHLGELHSQQDRLQEADTAFEEGEAALREVDHPKSLCSLLLAKGRHAARTGDAGGARACLAEAETLAAAIGAGAASSLGRAIEQLRERLGETHSEG